jgi:putative endonuclease
MSLSKMQNKKLGYKFEKLAKEFLEKQWYKILQTNFTIRWWEIDIIAFKDGIVSFVEVKWSSMDIDFQNYITSWKIKALKRAAEHWIYKNDSEKIKEYRFDLILIKDFKVIDFIEGFID